jgi:hypothetical protein
MFQYLTFIEKVQEVTCNVKISYTMSPISIHAPARGATKPGYYAGS